MKVTDYIIDFLVKKGVTDIFGYPGGVICHLMDSATKFDGIRTHTNYNEQASAFAACGYAQVNNVIGVAYSTSGPGATNLVTGVANAYFDSIPTLFITGQVDTYAAKGDLPIRQRGFQETDVVSLMQGISKYAVTVEKPENIKYYLEKAFHIAYEGNPGPVVLDLPADVQRADVDINSLAGYEVTIQENAENIERAITEIRSALNESKRPCILIGNAIKQAGLKDKAIEIIEKLNIPAIFSLPAFDILPNNHPLNFGFLGTNGHRYANFVLGKSDLIISIGARLDIRQIGGNREQFVPQAKLLRIDIDSNQLAYKVRNDEIDICVDVRNLFSNLESISMRKDNYTDWVDVCGIIRNKLQGYDDAIYNVWMNKLSKIIPDDVEITVDVGQNQLWAAQSFEVKRNQNVHMSAGHGAMGYSLPAAIGVHYASGRPIYCFNGDGGLMMNIQELQYIKREQIPIKIICINNYALGMIRGFQERNFNKNYTNTIEGSGWLSPDFEKLAYAFDFKYQKLSSLEMIEHVCFEDSVPEFIEVSLPIETNLVPNFGRNGLIQDQMPYIDRTLFDELMAL